MRTIIGITGTTAVGKSKTAVMLAKRLGTEIISCDSMQIYKEMDIGTAKITLAEQGGVKHHLLDVVYPNTNFSAFDFSSMATDIIADMENVPILVGGTGFYFDCLVRPPEFAECSPENKLKAKQLVEQQGLDCAVQTLQELDPDACDMIDTHNPKRVMRALEIAFGGDKISQGTGEKRQPQYNLILFVLQREREQLYKQIELRVDEMIQDGLVLETKFLYDKYRDDLKSYSSFSAIGYKELFDYFDGNCTLEQAIAQIKLNTRHYAKRQISYFKRMESSTYIDVDDKTTDEVVAEILQKLQEEKIV